MGGVLALFAEAGAVGFGQGEDPRGRTSAAPFAPELEPIEADFAPQKFCVEGPFQTFGGDGIVTGPRGGGEEGR